MKDPSAAGGLFWKLADNSDIANYDRGLGEELEDEMNNDLQRIQELLKPQKNIFNSDHIKSLKEYTRGDQPGNNPYDKINKLLRDGNLSESNDETTKNHIININDAFLKTPKTEKDIVVFRGLKFGINYYIDKNRTSNHEMYDKAYMSTTINFPVSEIFFDQLGQRDDYKPDGRDRAEDDYMCCFLMINIPKGSKVIPLKYPDLSMIPNEDEILFPSHSLLQFVEEHNLWNAGKKVSAKLYEYKYIGSESTNAVVNANDNAIEVEIQPEINLEPSAPSQEDLESPEVIKRPIKKNTFSARVGWDSIKMISRAVDQITNNPDFEPLRDMEKTEQEPFMPPLPEFATDKSTYSKSRLHKWMKKDTDKDSTPRKQSRTKKK